MRGRVQPMRTQRLRQPRSEAQPDLPGFAKVYTTCISIELEGPARVTKLLNPEEFRAAMKQAMVGREAKNASFSLAWANGELTREDFARWAENHYHYVGPFADYLAYIYANAPDTAEEAKDFLLQNMYE